MDERTDRLFRDAKKHLKRMCHGISLSQQSGRLPQHHGSEQNDIGTTIMHFPASSGVCERASEQMRAGERASTVNERVERAYEPTDERVALYLHLDSWLFWTIVQECVGKALGGPVFTSGFMVVLDHRKLTRRPYIYVWILGRSGP